MNIRNSLRSSQNKNFLRFKQLPLILQLQTNPNFHDKLMLQLKDKNHAFNRISSPQIIRRIQTFIKANLKKQTELLESYYNLQNLNITYQMKQQCSIRLLKLIQIIKLFYQNQQFFSDKDTNLQFYNKIVILTDNFQLITHIILLLLDTSFEKIDKQFYYTVYFLLHHIDIYDQKGSNIQKVYKLGEQVKSFQFNFLDQKGQQNIIIEDFYLFLKENKLINKQINYKHVSGCIMKKFNLIINKNSVLEFALQMKIKIFMRSVVFQEQTIRNTGDQVVKAISFANVMYCYIQFYLITVQVIQNHNIPNIFVFPPNYVDVFKEMLEIFFTKKSSKDTQLTIVKGINTILQIQQKGSSTLDIVGRLIDSTSLIYKYLNFVKSYLSNENSQKIIQKINVQTIADNNFMKELFKIMNSQIQQNNQLNSVAYSIVQLVFKKQTENIVIYSDEVVQEAGNIIMHIQSEQQKIMKVIVQKIQKSPENSRIYIKILNNLFSKKNRLRRRDLAYLARQSAQSCILVKVQPLIRKQIQVGSIKRQSFLVETLLLISNICEQSPSLVERIQKTNCNIIPYLFDILSETKHLPGDKLSIVQGLNFMYNVSLLESPIRDILKKSLKKYIQHIFTGQKFIQGITSANRGYRSDIAAIFGNFVNNFKFIGKYIFHGLINATSYINEEYQKLSILEKILICKNQVLQLQSSYIAQVFQCDSKLMNIFRVLQKSSKDLIHKFNSRSLYMLLRPIIKIFLSRDNVLLQNPLQNSLIKHTLNQIFEAIKEYNVTQEAKELFNKNENLIIQRSPQYSSLQYERMRGLARNGDIDRVIQQQPIIRQMNIQEENNQLNNQENNRQNNQNQDSSSQQKSIQNQNNDDLDMQNQQLMMINEDQQNQRNLFRSLTWQKVRDELQTYLIFDDLVFEQFKNSLKQLQNIIRPILKQKNIKEIIQKISKNSILLSFQNQLLLSKQCMDPKTCLSTKLKFDLQIFKLTVHSSKIERLFKFITTTLDFEHPKLRLQKYQQIIGQFSKYALFYLEIASYLIGNNIEKFIDNDTIKYLQTSKLPKNRLQGQTINVQQIKNHLQRQLNQQYTIYNVLLDTYLKTISNNLSSSLEFLKLKGSKHLSFINKILFEPIQDYIENSVVPLLKSDITAVDFQKFRQSLKLIMQVFVLNDSKPLQKAKPFSKLLLGFYLYEIDLKKHNIFQSLAKLSFDIDESYTEDGQVYEDTKQNRWKKIKKSYMKLTFYKMKVLMSNVFPEQPDEKNLPQLQQNHENYQIQKQRTYYFYSKIHSIISLFIECQIQKKYIKDLLMFNAAQFGQFCDRIRHKDQLVYFNYIFKDNSKTMTKKQLYDTVIKRNKQLMQKILTSKNLIISIPMILKGIFDMNRPTYMAGQVQFVEDLKNHFIKISEKLNSVCIQFTGHKLVTGFRLPSKQSLVSIPEQEQLDLKTQIQKVFKLISYIIEFIKYFRRKQFFEQGYIKISKDYIRSIVDFVSFLFSNLQIQVHFPEEGDYLVLSIIKLVQQFINYKQQKEQYLKKKKIQKRKQRHHQNKKKYKNLKNKTKQLDKQSLSNSQISSVSQIITIPKNRKHNEKIQKRNQKLKNYMKKQMSSAKKSDKKRKNKQMNIHQKQVSLNRSVTDFIKISFSISQEQSYLKTKTTQIIMNFLQKYSKDIVLDQQTDRNNKQTVKKQKFFVYSSQIFGDLLKLKLKNQKADGFFYMLSYLAMKLISQKHTKIDLECAIKRFFYEQKMKAENFPRLILSKQPFKVKMSQFQALLVENSIFEFPEMSYLLQFIEVKKVSKDSKNDKKQNQEQNYIYHQFNNKNHKRFLQFSDQKMYVALKNYDQLDLISLPSLKRRKASQAQQDQKMKKIKFYEYHPQGDFAALICQIINSVIRTLIKQVAEQFNQNRIQQKPQKSLTFNLKILLYTLQVLFRQSPTIVPWVGRFKCKKIILNQIKSNSIIYGSNAYKYLMSYIYGNSGIQIQNLQQISFLTLLIKFVYPLSQISTLLFEFALDNNVLIQDKNKQNNKQSKQKQKQNQQNQKKYVPFGSMIRQKILQQIQGILQNNKGIDQQYLKCLQNNKNNNIFNPLMLNKTSSMGILTILLSIKQFAKLCIENNLLKRVYDQYIRTNQIVKSLLNPNSIYPGLNSSVMRNFMLNFFLKPIQILQQLSIQYQISKKQNKNNFSNNKLHIKVLLSSDTINDQLFNSEIFIKSTFKAQWLYANSLLGDLHLQNQTEGLDDHMSDFFNQQQSDSMSADDMFDSSQILEDQPLIGQDNQIQISGQQLLQQGPIQQDDDIQNNQQWPDSSIDPFQINSNTFENIVLYPNSDQNMQQSDIIDEDDSSDQDDIDQQGIDHYDDSQIQDGDIDEIEQQSNTPIVFNSQHGHFGFNIISQNQFTGLMENQESRRIVPKVGIYTYFNPPQPQRRSREHHICNNYGSIPIRQLQCLYDIFMDVVSFENIVITNQMVKLQNQQANTVRKIFKLIVYKQLKGTKTFNNQNIVKIQEEYFQDIYKIFTLDLMIKVAEKIDFRECQKIAQFIKSIPNHYIDIFLDDPEKYFNEFPKAISKSHRFRRRHGRMLPMQMIHRLQNNRQRPPQLSEERILLRVPSRQNSQQNPQNFEQMNQQQQEEQQNQPRARLQVMIQSENGRQINFHSELDRILQNIGMTERQFMALPHDAQSDIIQQSIQSGSLNIYLNRVLGNQAPNVSPRMQPLQIQQERIQQEQSIPQPQSFEIEQDNNQRNENNQNHQNHQEDQNLETPIRQIQQQSQNIVDQVLPERYRKISLEHSQKISKDIIQILNKDGKNDSKFNQLPDQILTQITQQIFILQNKDFVRFPYSLLHMNMINSKNSSKIISTLLALLSLYPSQSQQNQLIQKRLEGLQIIKSRKDKNDLIPKTSLRIYNNQVLKDYEKEIYPNITTKILHILQNLTKSYTISMQMLKINSSPIKCLQKYSSVCKQYQNLLSFEKLIMLLKSSHISSSSVIVEYLLRITNNIVSHYFEKNIFSIHQMQKGSKKKIQTEAQEKDKQNKNNNNSMIQQVHKSSQMIQTTQMNKSIELTQESIQLLSNLLMSNDLRESKNLSQLIMKLSINGKNLIGFIKHIENILVKLCQKSIIFLNKKNHMSSAFNEQSNDLSNLMKVYCLLQMFDSMIKQFKNFAYRHNVDKYDYIIAKFKNIIESEKLYQLCQTITNLMTQNQKDGIIKNMPEIMEIFFLVFSINYQLSSNKKVQQQKVKQQEKQANKIARLGQIQINDKKLSLNKSQVQNTQTILISNEKFNKLWLQKVCGPKGKILINSIIKRKLSTLYRRKKQKNFSFYDIPMIKIALNTPHLLDFENKKTLFRSQVKRIKRKSVHSTLYLQLRRQQVFQQSFNFIMSKKAQDLRGQTKIQFEGQQGADAGGLTREWYQLLSKQMFNPNYCLFKVSQKGTTYHPSSTSYVNGQHLNYFKFIGRIVGKALFDGYMLPTYFTPAFYKHILKIPITYEDMQEQDYYYFKSLQGILKNSPVESYMQDYFFTYQYDNFGEVKVKQLVPGGQKIPLTQQNKIQYVQLVSYAKMATAIQAQLESFLQGLHDIVPHKYLKIFDPKQFEMMISGLSTIDIVDLKRNTQIHGFSKTDQIIIWLFQILESYDSTERTEFLQFVTGSSRVPTEGFEGLQSINGPQKFTIQKGVNLNGLPTAHTCFNTLDLPPYPSKQILYKKLTLAIKEGKQGFFGFR